MKHSCCAYGLLLARAEWHGHAQSWPWRVAQLPPPAAAHCSHTLGELVLCENLHPLQVVLYLLLQIAMMGGNVERKLDGSSEPVAGGKAARGPATKPMGVTDFLDKGLGGAQLPRKQQDRKEKEKLKRSAGQSTHSQWKSEAEMVLRQQYD